MSQFADDTSLFLDGTKKSFVSRVDIIDKFSQYSGLHMNADKTKVIWFGAPRPPEVKYLKNRNFEWNPEYFTLLGVRFSIHIDNITDDNIQLHKLYNIHPWPSFFKHLKKSTDDRKLLWLQFRIIHHILTTNRSVSKFKPNQCELCTFCNSNSETIEHVMWQCR